MAKETVKAVAEVEAVEVTAAKVEKEVKAEKKTTAKKATTAKKTTKKAETETAKAEKKTAAKKATTEKKSTKKAAAKVEMFLQYNDNQLDEAALLERVNDDCKAQGVEAKELKLYLKPQDNACYYVANGTVAGKVDLF
ncbi:MAG: hypothetical protein IJB96_06055 [Lachnospira sp.]|nr:hypothetical protein [Lachnospira sp.]